MHTTIEAEVDEHGAMDTALLSESSLATDWGRPEEDAAWTDLGRAQ
jgi:hypothetical protein